MLYLHKRKIESNGFTLIELSIVLVIIGLLAGGVLVGRDLMAGAALRSQISEIQNYNTAVNTFLNKYNGLPGDISKKSAAQFGFSPRMGGVGHGDNNGLLQGTSEAGDPPSGLLQTGEPMMFWQDMTKAGFANGTFTTYVDTDPLSRGDIIPHAYLSVPRAKIKNDNYLFVGSVDNANVYFLQSVSKKYSLFEIGYLGDIIGERALSIQEAYSIDSKIDDGLPTTGKVVAEYNARFAGLPVSWGGPTEPNSANFIADNGDPGSNSMATTIDEQCYDPVSLVYWTSQDKGRAEKCALSIQFK